MTKVFIFNQAGRCTQMELPYKADHIAALVNAGRAGEIIPSAANLVASLQGGAVILRPASDSHTLLPLNQHETQALYYVSKGMTTKQVSVKLGKSPRTVNGYISSIMLKLNVYTRPQMMARASRMGLIPDRLD